MATLGRFVERVEVYSIDEAFMDLAGYESFYPDLSKFAQTLRRTIQAMAPDTGQRRRGANENALQSG